ncbi:MAG: hypothetical protein DRH12_10105 [Deltaproteobacteria bacterium]|nr:MAG: hypothetical protein DRH12_10105 [Deltaproteobacteria bacterium]
MLLLHSIFGAGSFVVFYKLADLLFWIEGLSEKQSRFWILEIFPTFLPWVLGILWIYFGISWAESMGIRLPNSESIHLSAFEELGYLYLLAWVVGVIYLSFKGYNTRLRELEKRQAAYMQECIQRLPRELLDGDLGVRTRALEEIATLGSKLSYARKHVDNFVLLILSEINDYFGPDIIVGWQSQPNLFSQGRHHLSNARYLNLLLKALSSLAGPLDNPYEALIDILYEGTEDSQIRALEWIGTHTLPAKTKQRVSVYLEEALRFTKDQSHFLLALRFADAVINGHVDQALFFYTNQVILTNRPTELKTLARGYLEMLTQYAAKDMLVSILAALAMSGDPEDEKCASTVLDEVLARNLEEYSDDAFKIIYKAMTSLSDIRDSTYEDDQLLLEELKRRGLHIRMGKNQVLDPDNQEIFVLSNLSSPRDIINGEDQPPPSCGKSSLERDFEKVSMLSFELEADEERHCYRWEIIEGSEDYNVLESMGYDPDEENEHTYEYAKAIEYLQEVAPHIKWRITYDGTDSAGASPSQWRVICVPEHQIVEAQYIFDRFLNGDDLTNYSYTDRYPEIYERLTNGESKIKDDILQLFKALEDFQDTLYMAQDMDLQSFLENICIILPRIYIHASLLPYVREAFDLVDQGTVSLNKDIQLDKYNEFLFVHDPYKDETGEYWLSELLIDIYEEIEGSLLAFQTNNPDEIAAAVNHLRSSFAGEYGWGTDILKALYVAHVARTKLLKQPRY